MISPRGRGTAHALAGADPESAQAQCLTWWRYVGSGSRSGFDVVGIGCPN